MIKALEVGPFGRTIVIGLTWRNLELLDAGKPIRFSSVELGVRPAFDIVICAGPTAATIVADLESAGLPLPAAAAGEPRLVSATVAPVTAPGVHQPIAVFGLTAAGSTHLRTGGTLIRPLLGGRPAVRLLADRDTDRLAERITAGRPARESVDLRGGRTD